MKKAPLKSSLVVTLLVSVLVLLSCTLSPVAAAELPEQATAEEAPESL